MITSYPDLRRRLTDKNRGRKNEIMVSSGPDLWAYMPLGFDRDIQIYFDSSKQTVCTIRPDNIMTIDVGCWHTQTSCRIIEVLSGRNAWLYHNQLWHNGFPVDGPIEYGCDRRFIQPAKFVKINNEALDRMETVTLDDLPAKYRLMLELGTWDPTAAVTAKVKAFARGEIDKAALIARDIWTILTAKDTIITRLFEEAT